MIKAQNLGMVYGNVAALKDVSFEIEKGEIIGLIGPNGAGKSTTLKIITTYLYPTYGTAFVNGLDVREEPLKIRKLIGYLPEQLPLYMDMEVEEYLTFVGKARGLNGHYLIERLEWVKEKCGLVPVYKKLIRELSKGYRQRTALAQALLHDPEIVILDEPTSGLDPHQIIEIRELIKELSQNNKTIIFSTHILQEVQAVTNRVIIINKGEIIADGKIDELQKKVGIQTIELILPKDIKEIEVKNEISNINGVIDVEKINTEENENIYKIKVDSNIKDALQQISKLIKEKGWDFKELKKVHYTLEDIFLALTEPEKAEVESKKSSSH